MKPDDYSHRAKVIRKTGRTPAEEVAAFVTRVKFLLAKEARCPDCAKEKRLAEEAAKVASRAVEFQEGTTNPGICWRHVVLRRQMAYSD